MDKKFVVLKGNKMQFDLINIENWERKEHYNHYINNVVCGYSLTANLDITPLSGQKLYPAMLWLLSKTVNEMQEFRTSLSDDGVGYFSNMHPAYTIFNEQSKTFSNIWTEFDADYEVFLKHYNDDVTTYGASVAFAPKTNKPQNTFDVSMIPWATFTSFNLNIFGDGKYLLPIFTLGKYFEQDGKRLLPISVQVHHAACDGYHVGLFLESLQNYINTFYR